MHDASGKKIIYLLTSKGEIWVISVNSTRHFRTLESKSLLLKLPKGIEINRVAVVTCKGHSEGLLPETEDKDTRELHRPTSHLALNAETSTLRKHLLPAFFPDFFLG